MFNGNAQNIWIISKHPLNP